jgi:hypothetical protein
MIRCFVTSGTESGLAVTTINFKNVVPMSALDAKA